MTMSFHGDHVTGMYFRIPLRRMTSVRRTLVDNALAKGRLKPRAEAWSEDAAQFPVEKLSNFMDVSSSNRSSKCLIFFYLFI